MGLGDHLGLDQRHQRLGAFGPGLYGILAQPRVIGARHNGQPLGGDFGHDARARRVAVKAPQVIGHKVERVGLGFGQDPRAIGHRLRDGGGLGIGRTIGPQLRARVHQPVAGDAVALGHAIIVDIMRPRDLDRARAEIRIGVVIGDDRDQPAVFLGPYGNFAQHAHDGRIPRIARMHGHSAIAQHCFRARGGDRDVIALFFEDDVAVFIFLQIRIGRTARQRVLEMPHMARGLDILDLEIADRGFEMRVPVHQALAAIDKALVIHVDKDLDHRVVEIALFACGRTRRARHGKGQPGPVARRTQPLELGHDGAAGLLFPCPDMGQEFLAAHVAARFSLLGQFAFDHHLGRDARMIGAGLPERVKAAHPVPADQHILQRVVEGMAHMQNARHIGRRDHDGIGLGPRFGIGARLEATLCLPLGGNACLGRGGVKALVHRMRPFRQSGVR